MPLFELLNSCSCFVSVFQYSYVYVHTHTIYIFVFIHNFGIHRPPTYIPTSSYSSSFHSICRKMGTQFVHSTATGVTQFVVLKPLVAIIQFILELNGLYQQGSFQFDTGYLYLTLITNFSQGYAMYCLVLFYLAMQDDLKTMNPIPKFMCIKAVVFFTFWQSFFIALCVHMGWIHRTDLYSVDNISEGLQDFLICFEMLIAAFAHAYAFQPEGSNHN
jgi:hypothetical protein